MEDRGGGREGEVRKPGRETISGWGGGFPAGGGGSG
jgi:hypothetical protein